MTEATVAGRRVLTLLAQYPREVAPAGEGDRHVYVCPDPPAAAVSAGRALPIPRGEFDAAALWRCLPDGFLPDLVWISSTLARTPGQPTPVGVDRLPCPAVMKLTDSHHTRRPLRTLIEYARRVGCGHHWTTYNRQHLHFFVEAGLPQVFWMPGAISMMPHATRPPRERIPGVVFCGSVDRAHAYRARLLGTLGRAGIDVRLGRRPGQFLPWAEYLARYAEATIVFHCSLNGDLAKRVFEVLMAGGFLLTDRLAPESGLPRLFQEGVHLECYGSEAELLDKVRHYLAHPEAAAAIARRGQAEVLARYHPDTLVEGFYRIVLGGEPAPPLFAGADDPRVARAVQARGRDPQAFRARIECYELLQELHRLNPPLEILHLAGEADAGGRDWGDLPRLRVTRADALTPRFGAEGPVPVVLVDAPRVETEGGDLLDAARSRLAAGGVAVIRLMAEGTGRRIDSACRAAGLALALAPDGDEGTTRVYRRRGDTAGVAVPSGQGQGVLERLRRVARAMGRDRTR